MLEARCGTCQETFNPLDEGDLVHVERADGVECGGAGQVVGEWTNPMTAPMFEVVAQGDYDPAPTVPQEEPMPTTETKGVEVVVYGPNLWHGPQDAPETFHVHRPNCAHLRLRIYRQVSPAEGPWKANVGSFLDVVAAIYDPECFEYDIDDEDGRAQFETDIRVFPCVKGLA